MSEREITCTCEGESDSLGTWRSNPNTFCPEHDGCIECGVPFNNANVSASGRCADCEGDRERDDCPPDSTYGDDSWVGGFNAERGAR